MREDENKKSKRENGLKGPGEYLSKGMQEPEAFEEDRNRGDKCVGRAEQCYHKLANRVAGVEK